MVILDGMSVAVEMLNEGRGKGCRLNSWPAGVFTALVTGAMLEPRLVPMRQIEAETGLLNPHGTDQAMAGEHFLSKALVIPSDTFRSRGRRLKNLLTHQFMSRMARVAPPANLDQAASRSGNFAVNKDVSRAKLISV